MKGIGIALTSLLVAALACSPLPPAKGESPATATAPLATPTVAPLVTGTLPPPATATPPVTATPQATLPLGEARQDLVDAFLRVTTAYPYRYTQTNTATSITTIVVYEAAAEDLWRESWTSSDGSLEGETIFVGGLYYWKSESGGWTDTTEPPEGAASAVDTMKSITAFMTDVNRTSLGDWMGMPVWTYVFNLAGSPGTALVGTVDGLPYEVDVTETLPDLGEVQHVLVYEYGVSLDIQPPP